MVREEKPELILLDPVMPGVYGFEAFRGAKARDEFEVTAKSRTYTRRWDYTSAR
jgi:DNA-binding response OmpR family regulator